MQRILVVDDEPNLVKLLQYHLQQASFEVITGENGAEVMEVVIAQHPDAILLDWMLPGMDGLHVCRNLRAKDIHTPVLMLTARDDEVDRILGLEAGADDYITKPFSMREVVARVRAVLRRYASEMGAGEAGIWQVGPIRVDENLYEVQVSNQTVTLTTREFELLRYLCQHADRVVTRNQLLTDIWGYEFIGDNRIVDMHISHLRDKIEPNSKSPLYIKTIRRLGYKLVRQSANGF
ncbi:DNA-binding response regulator [Alicyclobacillaceae bacterium I2511]|nr:DNA-binding response regulator [Alicyclobacillaceae bacterium I2511]